MLIPFLACVSDEETEKTQVDFDQSGFLSNISGQVILPAITAYNTKAQSLLNQVDSFELNPSSNNFESIKSSFKETYSAWQSVNLYDFGPLESRQIKSAMNTYPCDSNLILQNAAQGNLNTDLLSNKLSRGLPALDFLLYTKNENFFADSNHFKVLKQLAQDVANNANNLSNDWANYQGEFNSRKGTDLGSSTGIYVNALNKHLEQYFRDAKIGIPIGIRSAGIARPQDAEAIYSELSIELIQENFSAIKDAYTGKSGIGLDDYLVASNADELNQVIMSQIAVTESKLSSLSGALPTAIQNDNTKLQECYNEIQKLIVYFKVDLPSRLGVLISYQDNDGD